MKLCLNKSGKTKGKLLKLLETDDGKENGTVGPRLISKK